VSFVEVETLERHTGERIIIIYTDSGLKYSDTSNFPYIFHIKQKFFKILSLSQLMSGFDNYFINKSRKMGSLL
jgi:hypothetical protein